MRELIHQTSRDKETARAGKLDKNNKISKTKRRLSKLRLAITRAKTLKVNPIAYDHMKEETQIQRALINNTQTICCTVREEIPPRCSVCTSIFVRTFSKHDLNLIPVLT